MNMAGRTAAQAAPVECLTQRPLAKAASLAMLCLFSLWFSTIAACLSGCGTNPATPRNANPRILSVDVFPSIIGASDSAIVYCRAVDADGDSLFYDWTADGRLRLQGVPSFFHFRYDSRSPTQVFYPAAVNTPSDTAWIEAEVRDHRGGMESVLVKLIINSQ